MGIISEHGHMNNVLVCLERVRTSLQKSAYAILLNWQIARKKGVLKNSANLLKFLHVTGVNISILTHYIEPVINLSLNS